MTESNHTPGAGTACPQEAVTRALPQDLASADDAARPAEGTARTLVGWREWVSLPAAHTPWIKAKIDTGARTSALHAFGVELLERDGDEWARFEVHPWQTSAADARIVELPVADVRAVRSSNGIVQDRVTVLMPLTLAGRTVQAEVTLTSRDEMGFRMLVGRSTLERGFLVDPAASYLGGQPPRGVRRRNRGHG